MTKNQTNLASIFSDVGVKYGYDMVDAKYSAFRDFKCKWSRGYGWVDFKVSDYIKGAPEDVLRALAIAMFDRIAHQQQTPFGTVMLDWLRRPEFLDRKRPKFLKRYEAHEDERLSRLLGNLPADDIKVYSYPSEVPCTSTVFNAILLPQCLDESSDDVILDILTDRIINVKNARKMMGL